MLSEPNHPCILAKGIQWSFATLRMTSTDFFNLFLLHTNSECGNRACELLAAESEQFDGPRSEISGHSSTTTPSPLSPRWGLTYDKVIGETHSRASAESYAAELHQPTVRDLARGKAHCDGTASTVACCKRPLRKLAAAFQRAPAACTFASSLVSAGM